MSPHQRRLSLLVVIALGVIDRAMMLFAFGFRYTGSDDVVFWQGARDYAQGIFHEPYMYGQDYNPMLESLLAVPGVWLGVPYAILMPLVTSLLALSPFWSLAVWHHRRDDEAAALVLAAIPLLLPVEHALMTTMTRGFVTGLAVLAVYPWTTGIVREGYRHLFGGTVLAAAVFVNHNAAVMAVPLGIHALITARRAILPLALMITGALPFAALWLLFRRFYADHPEGVMRRLYDWRMAFHPELIHEHFDVLGQDFAWLCPLLWAHGEAILALVAVPCLWLFLRRRWTAAFALFSGLVVVVTSFAFAKTQDGSTSVLFPLSRIYLGMPLLLGWSIALTWSRAILPRIGVHILVVVTAGFLLARQLLLPEAISRMISEEQGAVGEFLVADVRTDASALDAFSDSTGAELVLWSHVPKNNEALTGAYAGELLRPGLPPSLLISDDRRHWRVLRERTNVAALVLVVGGDPHAWQDHGDKVELLGRLPVSQIDLHVIRNNSLPTLQLIEQLGIQP